MKQELQGDLPDIKLDEKEHLIEAAFLDASSLTAGGPPDTEAGKPQRKLRILLIGGCVLVAVLVSAVAVSLMLPGSSTSPPQHARRLTPVQGAVPLETATLQEFLIPFKDQGGKERIFVCAIALEMKPDSRRSFNDEALSVRKLLYEELRNYTRENSSLLHDRNRLKDALIPVLNKQLGGSRVYGLYFTKFTFL